MNGKIVSFLVFFCLMLVCSGNVQAQFILSNRSSVSTVPEGKVAFVVGGGVAGVRSDICSGFNCNNLGLSVSGGAIYKLSQYLSVGGMIEYARLGATGVDSLLLQNISFQSEVIEVAGTVVLNLLHSNVGSAGYRSSRKRLMVPYVRAGVGFVYYTPSSFPGGGELRNSQITFEPERKYPATALAIPLGVGVRIRLNDLVQIAPELSYHITTTDFLDNISARPGSPGNDHFGIVAVKVLYTPELRNKIFSRP